MTPARLPLFAAAMATSVALLSACASMVSSKEELQSVRDTEGVVYGSFLINVEKSEEAHTGWSFLQGQKAGDATYAVLISQSGFNPLNYIINAAPEKEQTFIKKLPAGDYRIHKIEKQGFTNLELNLDVTFKVTPKQTTYIGKLVVQFPERIRAGSPVRMNVGDAQQATTDALKAEHGQSLSGAVKALMEIQHGIN